MLLQKLELKDFDKVYTIMEEAFPKDEIRPYYEQKEILSNPKFYIYILKDIDNDTIKAFISIYEFDNLIFIEHFATNSKFRNKGLGSIILKEIFKMYNCKICLEVELPATEISTRRIKFYKRNGFFENNYKYIQPAMAKDRKPVPLIVMTSGGEVSKNEFDKIKETLYKEVYKIGSN